MGAALSRLVSVPSCHGDYRTENRWNPMLGTVTESIQCRPPGFRSRNRTSWERARRAWPCGGVQRALSNASTGRPTGRGDSCASLSEVPAQLRHWEANLDENVQVLQFHLSGYGSV